MRRRAEFIWTPEQAIADLPFRQLIGSGPTRREDGQNRWMMFRKRISIAKQPDAVTIDITVDGGYLLFVNNQRVGRGPARSAASGKLLDSYTITPLLSEGENVVAVLVHVYGIDTAWYETSKDYWQALFGDGGLNCVAYSGQDKDRVLFATDGSWRCAEAVAWNRATPLSGWGQDFIEEYDARQEVRNWTSVNFDDANWSRAQVLVDKRGPEDHAKGFGPIRPFPVLRASNLPPLAEKIVSPVEVVATFGLKPNAKLPIDERQYAEEIRDLPAGAVDKIESLLSEDEGCTTIRTTDTCDVGLLLRVEPLCTGYPFVELTGDGGEIVELAAAERFAGEFSESAQGSPRIVRSSFLEGAHLFRYTARVGEQRFEKFQWTSVRYLQLVVRNAPNGLRIRHVGVRACHYPVVNEGKFECSDVFLNALWKTARHTVLQCSHDAWEDCPGREKRQWVGDGVSRYPAAAAAFGTSIQPLDRLFLQQIAASQRTDGLVQMYAPGDHKTSGIVIPDYSIQYLLIAQDYLLHTGDIETIHQIWPAIPKILDWFQNFVDDGGLLSDIPHWHFIEWANVDRQGSAACINALYAAALQAAACIARYLDMPRYANRYESQYRAVRDALNKHFWENERGVYVDSDRTREGASAPQVSQHTNALALLFDIAPDDRRSSIIAYITDARRTKLTAVPPVVPVGEMFDAAHDVVQCNSFFSHFLYSALGHCGRSDLALQLIRKQYAPMLATGASTLWESFDPSASLCHAFSASPLYQLSAFLLGVRPTDIGFRTFVVAPQLADLTSASGAYPTPAGPISVTWRAGETDAHIHVTVPDGLSGAFVPPTGFRLLDSAPELGAGDHELFCQRDTEHD